MMVAKPLTILKLNAQILFAWHNSLDVLTSCEPTNFLYVFLDMHFNFIIILNHSVFWMAIDFYISINPLYRGYIFFIVVRNNGSRVHHSNKI
jgi:hypothetical protein